MEINTLEDLRTLDLDKMKKEDLVKVLRKAIQLTKGEIKKDEQADQLADKMPMYAVSADKDHTYVLKFDPSTKEGRVVDVQSDSRGSHMNFYKAEIFLQDTIIKAAKGK